MGHFWRSDLPLVILFLCSALWNSPCNADADAPTQMSLAYSSKPIAVATGSVSQPILQSRGGQFGLKFQPVGELYLLAVVYLLHNETIVWSANRNSPVSHNATLRVSRDGNLIVEERVRSSVWSANVTSAYEMVLNPNGNLVINGRSGAVLWESFDHPTDTVLPGQSVRAGTFLVASVSAFNSSESNYMAGVLPGGGGFFAMAPQFFPYGILEFNPLRKSAREAYISLYNSTCNHTVIGFSSDGSRLTFQQEGNVTDECKRETGHNSNGSSVPLQVSNNSTQSFRYLKLDPDGDIRVYLQTPEKLSIENDFFGDFFNDICRLPNNCGPYGICNNVQGAECSCPTSQYFSQSSASCKPKEALQCNSTQTFVELRGIDYFPSRYVDPIQVSIDECKRLCLSNCSCVAAFYYQTSGSCFHYQELLSMRNASDETMLAFIKVQPLPGHDGIPAGDHGKGFWKRPLHVIGISLGAAVCFLLAFLSVFCVLRIKKRRANRLINSNDGEDDFLKTLQVLPPRFTFEELKQITNDFSRKVGCGGFGSVYEGVLPDGITFVAVKQLEYSSQGYAEFRTEIATMGSLNHVNLVRLRGFCAEEMHHLLVYEYMPNRSLDGWLFSSTDTTRLLNWDTRLSIAIDTARGLSFLHEESRECILHLDIKPENILLDSDFRAKLSDFGLSRLMDRTQQSRVLTGMRGTPGYLAPEWLMETGVTSKSDVYSLGIVLLELVAGRRCVDLTASAEEDCYLPAATIRRLQDGNVKAIADPRLVETGGLEVDWVEESVRKMIVVALWCIQEDPAVRPKASAVIRMLQGHVPIPEPPITSLQSAVARPRHIWVTSASSANENVNS
eukprot:Gb_14924 [translate_table: standard]